MHLGAAVGKDELHESRGDCDKVDERQRLEEVEQLVLPGHRG